MTIQAVRRATRRCVHCRRPRAASASARSASEYTGLVSGLARGVLLAAVAAIAFGVTTPIAAWAGAWIGPFSTACLLYTGAAGAAFVFKRARALFSVSERARLLAIALCGGAIAPVLLAWGLTHSGATIGSLLLNLEAVFTVLLSW